MSRFFFAFAQQTFPPLTQGLSNIPWVKYEVTARLPWEGANTHQTPHNPTTLRCWLVSASEMNWIDFLFLLLFFFLCLVFILYGVWRQYGTNTCLQIYLWMYLSTHGAESACNGINYQKSSTIFLQAFTWWSWRTNMLEALCNSIGFGKYKHLLGKTGCQAIKNISYKHPSM